eukprot:1159347-Pelagomonas_calceolata.AAC.4
MVIIWLMTLTFQRLDSLPGYYLVSNNLVIISLVITWCPKESGACEEGRETSTTSGAWGNSTGGTVGSEDIPAAAAAAEFLSATRSVSATGRAPGAEPRLWHSPPFPLFLPAAAAEFLSVTQSASATGRAPGPAPPPTISPLPLLVPAALSTAGTLASAIFCSPLTSGLPPTACVAVYVLQLAPLSSPPVLWKSGANCAPFMPSAVLLLDILLRGAIAAAAAAAPCLCRASVAEGGTAELFVAPATATASTAPASASFLDSGKTAAAPASPSFSKSGDSPFRAVLLWAAAQGLQSWRGEGELAPPVTGITCSGCSNSGDTDSAVACNSCKDAHAISRIFLK